MIYQRPPQLKEVYWSRLAPSHAGTELHRAAVPGQPSQSASAMSVRSAGERAAQRAATCP